MASDKDDTSTNHKKDKDVYASQWIKAPTLEQLSAIATKLNLHMDQDELKEYHGVIKGKIAGINSTEDLVEPSLPTRYPRLPGYRPERSDNPYNAWHWRSEIQGARSGKLTGKRVAIKDNIAVAGVPMMNGCHALKGFTPDFDASVVTRVLDAGATIVGKTVCEDLCFSACSSTSAQGPVLNPHDPTRSSGGSSSGNAVVLHMGEADMAIGGDQGGSIRIPASWTGVVGLKPTYGLVPYTGAMGGDSAVDHLGPMARTVSDCALLLEVIGGYDGGFDQRQQSNIQIPEYTKELSEKADISGLKIGVLREGCETPGTDHRVLDLIRDIITKTSELGAIVEDASVPLHARYEHQPQELPAHSREPVLK